MFLNCPNLDTWHRSVPKSGRAAALGGFAIVTLCGAGFGVWAAAAPLEGAVVAHGTFMATGQNKQVQHLEGGIIQDVLVKEGDIVEPGQVLVVLDKTAASARARRLQLRFHRLVMSRARLEAEIAGGSTLEVPERIQSLRDDPEIAALIRRQEMELDARQARLAAEQEVLRKEIAGLNESIAGFAAQETATRARLALFVEELEAQKSLLDRQLARRSEVLSVRRAEATTQGELGQITARISDARERVARAEQRIVSLTTSAKEKAVEELRTVEAEIDDVDEQIREAEDILGRTEIRAPVKGAIVKINHHTAGGVIGAGDVLLELLPVNDELVIEARISPSDVAQVKIGGDAVVRLTAMNQRLTPMIGGELIYVSPDAVADQSARQSGAGANTRGDSFVARVRLDPADPFLTTTEFRATPGMPADVYIKTAERTFFEYIMRPVFDSFSRAFREQ